MLPSSTSLGALACVERILGESSTKFTKTIESLGSRVAQLDEASKQDSLHLYLVAYDQHSIYDFGRFVQHSAASLGAQSSSIPTDKKYSVQRWSVLASPFAHQRAWRQFERRSYRVNLKVGGLHPERIDTFVWYLKQNLPSDLQVTVRRFQYLSINELLSLHQPL